MKFAIISLFLCPFTLCIAWGNLAHRTIALIAEKHILCSPASDYVHSLLKDTSISDAAIWADAYKFLPEGRFTSSWHYLNTYDNPPQTCNVSYIRDSNRPCIIDATMNMTRRVNDPSLHHEDKKQALVFLLHFIGDLHCPLHVEGLLRGGNDIIVLWEGTNTSLHFVWDVSIPQKLTDSNEENEETAAAAWAEKLYNQKQDSNQLSINFYDQTWDPLNDTASLILEWARQANSFVCRTVLKDGVDALREKELSGSYYEESIPVVEYLIRSAGLRLAEWIKGLAREEQAVHREL